VIDPTTIRTVFMGTPEFALPTLEGVLAAGLPVVGVYTQPDRPSGRG
jgi:methionyl-tRNA formyltransferase